MREKNAYEKAMQISEEAASLGFDFPDYRGPLDKIIEEVEELRFEIQSSAGSPFILDELGDIFFSAINLARKLKIDPERALASCNAKFEQRFSHVKFMLEKYPDASLEEMEEWWQAAKTRK